MIEHFSDKPAAIQIQIRIVNAVFRLDIDYLLSRFIQGVEQLPQPPAGRLIANTIVTRSDEPFFLSLAEFAQELRDK